ncbi:MAG: hypothetical protein ACKVVT_02505 [Dehalococcoidia bacterium]
MALDVRDVEDFIRLLRDNPELRDAARRELVDEDMRALPLIVRRIAEAQERTEVKVEELAEAQRRTEAKVEELATRVDQLAEAQRRTELKLAEVVVALGGLQEAVAGLSKTAAETQRRLDHIDGRLANLEGWRYEMKFNVISHLWDMVRKPVRVAVYDIDAVIDARDAGKLSDDDWQQLRAVDGVYLARLGRGENARQVYVTVEISKVVDRRDIERAADRAAILRRCGLDTLAAAAGSQVTLGGRQMATERQVHLLVDRPNDAVPDEPDDRAAQD